MKRICQIRIIVALLFAASICWAGETYTAKVVGIRDGDTINVLRNGKKVRIRLYGIDTPEKRQPFSSKAKQFTSQEVFRKTVTITSKDIDRYGRTVALIQLLDNPVTLNEALVRQGYAWVYRKYCRDNFCKDWLKYEGVARASGRGLWADPDPIPPWEFRRR